MDTETQDQTLARWCVLLTAWVWPPDLPGKPNPLGGLADRDERMAIRGAYAAIAALADQSQVDAIWQDEPRRRALIDAASSPGA